MNLVALPVYELAALATAICWAATSIIAAKPAAHLGAVAFSRLRQCSIAVLLALFVSATGRWQAVPAHDLWLLVASGVVGIFLGDSLLFTSLNRLGPRRSSILFSLNAPMGAVLGWLILDERLSLAATIGIGICIGGVMLAIFFGNTKSGPVTHDPSLLWSGIALGLVAAFSQAVGSILVRPVMATGLDPFMASTIRIGTAGICLLALMSFPIASIRQRNPLTFNVASMTIFTGILAMGVGATLLLFALSGGKTGIVSTISATSPALVLPLLWATTGTRPAAGAWAGAGLAVIGMALIFLGR